tara:strand:+ start:260 stop:706 length:447 start_codon:yes stop_codon:yes gene_type:complete
MIKVDVVLDYPIWKKKIKSPEIYIKKRLLLLSKIYPFSKKSQKFTLFLTNNKKMKSLNNIFRKKNKPTDVLSFPFNNRFTKKPYLGDVAISFEIIKKRSNKSNFLKEFDKMWVHGYLHLVGYSHGTIKKFKKMDKKENLILKYFYKKN